LGLVFTIKLGGFLPLFDPQKGAHYFNEPDLFEASAREYVVDTFGEEWAGKFRLKGCNVDGVDWYDDYCDLMKRFRNGEGLGDGLAVVERWCSLESYGKMTHRNFFLSYPLEEDTSDFGPLQPPVVSSLCWSISTDGDCYRLLLKWKDGRYFNHAFCSLILSHLFYNFHAMFSGVVGYRFIPGECVAEGCGDFYLRLKQRGKGPPPTQPRFCSKACRNRENVRKHRARKREALLLKAEADSVGGVASGKSVVGGQDWQSQVNAPIDGEQGAQLKIGASTGGRG